MTDFEHADISRRLALAIGWVDAEMKSSPAGMVLECRGEYGWRLFSYDDPAVIWPIAERLNCFPYALRDNAKKLTGQWNAWASDGIDVQADTAALAVALAVIKAKEGK